MAGQALILKAFPPANLWRACADCGVNTRTEMDEQRTYRCLKHGVWIQSDLRGMSDPVNATHDTLVPEGRANPGKTRDSCATSARQAFQRLFTEGTVRLPTALNKEQNETCG